MLFARIACKEIILLSDIRNGDFCRNISLHLNKLQGAQFLSLVKFLNTSVHIEIGVSHSRVIKVFYSVTLCSLVVTCQYSAKPAAFISSAEKVVSRRPPCLFIVSISEPQLLILLFISEKQIISN
jgi:hypothetical protein